MHLCVAWLLQDTASSLFPIPCLTVVFKSHESHGTLPNAAVHCCCVAVVCAVLTIVVTNMVRSNTVYTDDRSDMIVTSDDKEHKDLLILWSSAWSAPCRFDVLGSILCQCQCPQLPT